MSGVDERSEGAGAELPTLPARPGPRRVIEPGTGRYVAGEEIARGGMGRVIEATDTLLGRSVAVKEVLIGDPDALRRFARETRITARLEHPSIVPVYDAGTRPDGTPYYVMRKVTGQPLDELVRERKPLGERLALLPNILAITQAMAHAHSRGVIHRDLKPTNILIGAFGETVLIDWGLAKVIGEPDDDARTAPLDSGGSLRTNYGAVLGTPGFMPPEQIASADVDKPADVYALGATLYYLLARRPPHSAATGEAILEAAAKGPPQSIGELVPGVPRALSTIVDKALAFDLAHRYPDAGALAEDLARFLTGQLVAAHRYSRRERLSRLWHRHRAALIVSAAGVAILAIGAWFAVGRVIDARIDANDQQRIAETERARVADRELDLRLAQARGLVDKDPALALAQLVPLGATDRWREARDLAADARGHGIARQLPSSPMTHSIALADDAIHAASAGEDGAIRVYDLVARTARTVAQLGHAVGITFLDPQHLLVDDHVTIGTLDLATGTLTPIATAAPPQHVQVAAGTVAWLDRDHHAYRLAAGAPAPQRLEADPEPRAIALSDDGKRVAIGGPHGLWLVDSVPMKILEMSVLQLAWAPGGRRIAAQLPDQLLDVHVEATRLVSMGSWSVIGEQAMAYVGDKLAILGFGWLRDEHQVIDLHFPSGARPIDLFGARGDLLVAGVSSGEIVVFDGKRRRELRAPMAGLEALTGDPRSPYLLGISHGQVYAWNLEEPFGRAFPLGDLRFADQTDLPPHHLLVQRPGVPAMVVDLPTGSPAAGPIIRGMRATTSPSGAMRVVLDDAHAMFLVKDQDLRKLADGVMLAAFVDEARIAIATARGIELFSLLGRRADLIAPGVKVDEFRVGGGWLYASAAGTVVRIELATERTSTFERPLAPSAWTVDDTGVAWIADANRLTRWELDGRLALHATLPSRILAVIGALAGRIALDTEQGGSLVETDRADRAIATISLGTSVDVDRGKSTTSVVAQLAPAAELLAIPLAAGGATLVDARTGEAWSLGQTGPDSTLAHVARDGSCLYELGDVLRVWTLALPTTREATVRWLADLAAPIR